MLNYNFNEDVIRQSVLNFMRQLDILPAKTEDEYLILDGHLHRYKTREDKGGDTTGAYCIFLDHWPAGWVQDWRKGDAVTWSFSRDDLDDNGKSFFDDKTFQENLQKSRERQKQLREAREQQFAKAADSARAVFQQLSNELDPYFTYLQNKKVNPIGVKFNHRYTTYECIVVPLYNINGHIQSLQYIYANGSKKFYPGASSKAAFCPLFLPDNPDIILVGEGYATMATVYQLTGYPSVAAMNCGNLQAVCEALKGKYPQARIIITADNDHRTANNPGLTKAHDVCDKLNLQAVVAPDFNDSEDGTDWNDFYLLHGHDYTANIIKTKIERIPLEAKQAKYRKMAEKLGIMGGDNFADFCTPTTNDNWLIQDWLPSESLMMLFAPSGSGKGFVALDTAFAVACPKISMWNKNKVLKHGAVVYLAGEGQRGLKKRCAGLARFKGINPEDVDMHFINEAVPLDDKAPELGVQKVIANIGMRCPNPALIYIDTANRYMAGDENKTVDATAFIRACTEIMNEFHCSVVVIHHTGQAQDTQGRARGSSVFKAAMDMEFKVSKSGSTIALEMTKSKDTELQKPLVFKMKSVAAPGFFNSSGEQESTCVLQYDEEITQANSMTKKPERISQSEQFAIDTYREAAREHGILIDDEKEGKDIVAVSVEDWRKVCYRMSSADREGTKRQHFNRSRKVLLEVKGMLFKRTIDGEEYYCLKSTGEPYEIGIIHSIRERQ